MVYRLGSLPVYLLVVTFFATGCGWGDDSQAGAKPRQEDQEAQAQRLAAESTGDDGLVETTAFEVKAPRQVHITVGTIGPNFVALKWAAVAGATAYRIFREHPSADSSGAADMVIWSNFSTAQSGSLHVVLNTFGTEKTRWGIQAIFERGNKSSQSSITMGDWDSP